MYTCLWVVEPYRLYSAADATSAASMHSRICPARRPPPIASKAIVAPVATSAAVRSSVNDGAVELQTCSAPADRSIVSCSGDRTMLTRPIPSARHSRFSIWPRFDAAAVCTSAVWPSRRIVPTRPSTVSGFTKHDAPSTAVTPSGNCEALRHVDAPVLRVHRAAEHGDGLAEQRLGRVGRSRGDDGACALVADRQGVADTPGEGRQRRR